MKLYQFYWDCGRMGSLDGLFAAAPEEVAEAVGHELYFGEVLGKHSEIYGTLEASEITELAVPEEVVEILVKAVGYNTISGFNPVEQYQQQKEDGAYDDEVDEDEE